MKIPIKPTFSDIIKIACLVFAALMGYSALVSSVDAHAVRIQKLEDRTDRLVPLVERIDERTQIILEHIK